MSTAKNDITGDTIATKSSSDAYRDGWERIFGKKKNHPVEGQRQIELPQPSRKKRGNVSPARAK